MSIENPPSTDVSTNSDRQPVDGNGSVQFTDKLDSLAKNQDLELRSELMRYGVDPRLLDSTALELYALFRISPKTASGDSDSTAMITQDTALESAASDPARAKLSRFLHSVLNVLGLRDCAERGNRHWCVLAAGIGALYALTLSGSKHFLRGVASMAPHLI
jgi:hypothetical protein